MRYRTLDPQLIIETAERLEGRIGERFPEAGLRGVAAELGIVKGQPFTPNAKDRTLLDQAARAATRIAHRNRRHHYQLSRWMLPSRRFGSSGARQHDYFSDTKLGRGAKARGTN